MHGFVEIQPNRRALMIQEKVDTGAIFFTRADLDVLRHFDERMHPTEVPQIVDQIMVKVRRADGAHIDRPPRPKLVNGQGR